MTYEIKIYGNPVLREQSRSVEKVDDNIRQLVSDMLDTMHERNGVGLAAQQIGRTESICVIDVPDSPDNKNNVKMPMALINPNITESSGTQTDNEGCLSFPEISASIKRSLDITVEYTDLENTNKKVKASGLLARAIQHEMDHLNGILIVDRMSLAQKAVLSGKLKRLKKTG